MQCPCCGNDMAPEARGCACGARFVGEPLGKPPVTVQRFGPGMVSLTLLLAVVGAALTFTKWLALGGVIVVWSAWRATRLARRDPEGYGGYRTAAATLAITLIAGSVAAGFALYRIPRFLEQRRARHEAATRVAMYELAARLDTYRREFGSYPTNAQALRQATNAPLPTDYWERGITYRSYAAAIATSNRAPDIQFTTFELRSAGPDGRAGNDDDIIMHDGKFYTHAELVKQAIIKDSAEY